MNSLLYLMHVPWGWIKQRPHFLAEQLALHFEVKLFFRKPFIGRHLLSNDHRGNLTIGELTMLPFTRFSVIDRLNRALVGRRLYSEVAKNETKIIWITHPDMYELIDHYIPGDAIVVYDCMDEHLSFPVIKCNKRALSRIARGEAALFSRSNIVFASSEALKLTLSSKYPGGKQIIVLNNGIHLEDSEKGRLDDFILHAFKSAKFAISYIGTISGWFDVDLVISILQRYQDVTVLLFGPCEIKLPKHPRLINLGPIQHRNIFSVMSMSDALIMPFKLTDLVLSVNPVKLYEYVFSGKPSIAVKYPESSKFEDYVFLYSDHEDCMELVGKLVQGDLENKRSAEASRAFAANNTWENRCKKILTTIETTH